MKILGTGLTGLIGARITSMLHPDFEFVSVSRTTGVDITKKDSIKPHIENFNGEYVLHMAAKADVDGCEKDKEFGENGDAWKINVNGTHNIASLCKEFNKTIIYISTDFVFNGEKEIGESYTEEDTPDPINWYGYTKYEGEKKVIESGARNIILRIAYPYGISSAPKKDFARIIADRLRNNLPIKGITDHIFVPTYIDDIAYAIQTVIKEKKLGLYHAVGGQALSPYDASIYIAQELGLSSEIIGKTTRDEYFVDKAKRPRNLNLSHGKIDNLGVHMRKFAEGIKEVLK